MFGISWFVDINSVQQNKIYSVDVTDKNVRRWVGSTFDGYEKRSGINRERSHPVRYIRNVLNLLPTFCRAAPPPVVDVNS